MPVLQIGQTSISYTVRYSSRTKRQHIVVTPEAVEVVAPTDTPQEQIAAFLDTKRRWLFNAVEDCRPKNPPTTPQHYVSGAKVMYRGRRLMLQIEEADVERVTITCKQTSKVHTGFCKDIESVLDRLLDAKVRPPQVKSSAVEMTDVGMKQAIHFLSVTAPTVGMEKLSTSPHKED